ncbi:hypothetical protein CPB83DRAFT_840612 [Crepidotus variabilis]|uniref:Uncharacterized protein n=1 Tax=Crepidotus variabilis TaxID=179855 RepID=A0A9P6JIG5_9AGAR|nr:hypothetical protein CPB83DRAFT_840612 [Crepidotus variabilis]
MILPAEILDHVLSFLQDDAKSLRICFKASSSIVSLVERHLYAHIILLPREPGDDHNDDHVRLNRSQLAVLLAKKPHIARYVKSIRVVIMSIDCGAWTLENDQAASTEQDASEPSEDSEPPYLPALKAFTLDYAPSDGSREVSWNLLPVPLRSYMKKMIHVPSIEQVSLRRIQGFPSQALNGCPRLHRLHLCGGWCTDLKEATSTSNQDENLIRPEIHHFQVGRGLYQMHNLASWFPQEPHDLASGTPDFSCLRSLEFRSKRNDFTLLSQMLNVCAETLEELTIDLGKKFSTAYAATISSLDLTPSKSHPISGTSVRNENFRMYEFTVPFTSQILEEIIQTRGGCALRSVVVKIHFSRLSYRSPSLAEMDFSSLAHIARPGSASRVDALSSSSPSVVSPSVGFLISPTKGGRHNSQEQVLLDVQRNQSLGPLVKDGKISLGFINEAWYYRG